MASTQIEEFLDRYYKPTRYRGRGKEYAQALLASHTTDYQTDGYDVISKFDSVTGKMEILGEVPWKRRIKCT